MSGSGGGLSGSAWTDTSVPFEEALDGTLGFEVLSLTDELARGRVSVTDRVRQMWGLVYDGVYSALAEMPVSEATISGAH
jgi:acyl-coenzyme A thioesterase PaaI-like protein